MISSAALAVYLIELLKKALPIVVFSPKAMAALLVVANAVAAILLALLGLDGYTIPTDWLSWAKTLVVAVLSALVSSTLYVVGYIPFKLWAEEFKAIKEIKFKGTRKSK